MSKKTISVKSKLINFENKVKKIYEHGKIKAPIHLSGGNEEQLILIFDKLNITPKDWIFSTWRSHYHWLLSGRSEKELMKQILDGKSMHVYGDKFFTSAIVGGISPIAVGVAYANRMKGNDERVFVFLGDSAYHCGITKECIRYASGHCLDIVFIVEDNGLSVNADTLLTWGINDTPNTLHYYYRRKYPHAGTGKYIMF